MMRRGKQKVVVLFTTKHFSGSVNSCALHFALLASFQKRLTLW